MSGCLHFYQDCSRLCLPSQGPVIAHYVGLSSFLHVKPGPGSHPVTCYRPLCRAVFFSTQRPKGPATNVCMVIAHYVELSSFLLLFFSMLAINLYSVIAHYVGLSSFLLPGNGNKSGDGGWNGYRPLCRAVFFSTPTIIVPEDKNLEAVIAHYVGLSSFLPHSSENQYLCGLQSLFLHVFFRIF